MDNNEFQEMIVQGILGVLKQGKRCDIIVDGYPMCCYDDKKGNHCIVGHMMTKEELIRFGLFLGPVSDLFKLGWRSHLNKSQINILIELQKAHDNLSDDFINDFTKFLKNSVKLGPYKETINQKIKTELGDKQ